MLYLRSPRVCRASTLWFCGLDSKKETRKIFNQLHASKEQAEVIFEGPMEWDPLDGRRACRISSKVPGGGYKDPEEKWPKIHDAMIEQMIRLDKALTPHVKKLK